MSSEIDIKTERLLRVMNSHEMSGVLLNGQHNFAWITDGASNGVDHSRDNGVASILITRSGDRFLLANKIEMPRMLAEELSESDFKPVDFGWQDEKATGCFVIGLATDLAGGPIATDLLMDESTAAIEGSIASCRRSLTQPEIQRFRALGREASDSLDRVFDRIAPGQTEAEIANSTRAELEKQNIRSVVTLVAADDRIAKYRHPVPTTNVLKRTVMLVTCARRHGLTVSLTRIATIGPDQNGLKEKTKATAFVYASLLHATREGATGREIYDIAANAYSVVGFPDEINNHHQGGAAGYRTREWVIHPDSNDTVEPDQAFAWNPSITGTKVEDTVIASGGRCEVITASAKFPQIATEICGVIYCSAGILEM